VATRAPAKKPASSHNPLLRAALSDRTAVVTLRAAGPRNNPRVKSPPVGEVLRRVVRSWPAEIDGKCREQVGIGCRSLRHRMGRCKQRSHDFLDVLHFSFSS